MGGRMMHQAARTAFAQSHYPIEAGRCLRAAFQQLGTPRSLLDVGCGPGHWITAAKLAGVAASGVDLSLADEEVSPSLQRADLTRPWRPPSTAEMVLCLEVAEHLPASAAETLVGTLADCLGVPGVLLFSAATPGQGGSGHVNEQPHEWWVERLEAARLVLDRVSTARLRRLWTTLAPRAWWYGKNVLVFRKGAR
jgi:SAM-dependent methyltransferase